MRWIEGDWPGAQAVTWCVLHQYQQSDLTAGTVHMKEGMWRPPSQPSFPLVTVFLSLKNEEALYASREQYLKSCLHPVPFPKCVMDNTPADLISTSSYICFMRDKKYIIIILIYPNLLGYSQFQENCWVRPGVLNPKHVPVARDYWLVHDWRYGLQSFSCPSAFIAHI